MGMNVRTKCVTTYNCWVIFTDILDGFFDKRNTVGSDVSRTHDAEHIIIGRKINAFVKQDQRSIWTLFEQIGIIWVKYRDDLNLMFLYKLKLYIDQCKTVKLFNVSDQCIANSLNIFQLLGGGGKNIFGRNKMAQQFFCHHVSYPIHSQERH